MRREKMWPELEVGWIVGWVREHMEREAGQAGAESVCSGSGSHWSRATENHVDTADAVLQCYVYTADAVLQCCWGYMQLPLKSDL